MVHLGKKPTTENIAEVIKVEKWKNTCKLRYTKNCLIFFTFIENLRKKNGPV